MDLSESIVPRSDQANAEDLITGPRVVTIVEVRAGSAEQPVEIVTDVFGPGRPFKPSKTVRRILVAAWGPDSSAYVGRRMTLYRDPAVRFGGDAVGGIRISHLSDIAKPLTLALTVTRGKRAPHVVQPLREERSQVQVDTGRAIEAFAGIGVTEAQLVAKLGSETRRWTPRDLGALREVLISIQRGQSTVAEQFPSPVAEKASAPAQDEPDDYDPTVDPNSGYVPLEDR